MTIIKVACATDDQFAPHCAVMLRSMLAHAGAELHEIYIMHKEFTLSEDNYSRLEETVSPYGVTLKSLPITERIERRFPVGKFHESCWYRLLLPELLPGEKRVLYLDSDIVITDSLLALWETKLADNVLAAVTNPLYHFMPDRAAALGLGSAAEYLNSGVLLFDLNKMRESGITELAGRYALKNPENPWPEQDALSVVCRGRWLALHPRWNVQTTIYDLKSKALPWPAAVVVEAKRKPAIIHFIGPRKPWHYLCRHPERLRYHEHRAAVPWPVEGLEGKSLKNRLTRPFSLGTQLKIDALLRAFWSSEAPLVQALQFAVRSTLGMLSGPPEKGASIVDALVKCYPKLNFVQIGSNDGQKHDPIHTAITSSDWTGVLVEPVPYVYARLRENYADYSRLATENAAIATTNGKLPFYHLREDDDLKLPDWYDELGSFKKEVLLKHIVDIPDIADRVVCRQVPCITFDDLCRRHGLDSVELLHIDTEGYDFEILKTVDFSKWRPILVIYEHKHLNADDRIRCRALLEEQEYQCIEESADTWCVKTLSQGRSHDRFLRKWRRIVRLG